VVVVLSSFFVAMELQLNECFTKSRYDHLLFTILFVFVSHAKCYSLENFSGPWRVTTANY
jgi:hypothetical protein